MRLGLGPAKNGQNFQNMSSLWRHLQKTSHRNRKLFFLILTRRLAESVEGLNSSLAVAAGDLWPKNCEPIYWLARSLKGTDLWLLLIFYLSSGSDSRQNAQLRLRSPVDQNIAVRNCHMNCFLISDDLILFLCRKVEHLICLEPCAAQLKWKLTPRKSKAIAHNLQTAWK